MRDATEVAKVVAAVRGHNTAYWVNVKCTSNGVWDDGDANGYITNTNSYWSAGEPNGACGGEQCLHIEWTADGKWNDIACDTNYRYICAPLLCEREQTISTYSNPA